MRRNMQGIWLAVLVLLVLPVSASAGPYFAPSSWINKPLPANAPISSSSAQQVAELNRAIAVTQGSPKTSINTLGYTTAFYSVGAIQPTVTVTPTQGGTQLAQDLAAVPLPTYALPSAGTDGWLTVYQPATDTLWEFWQLRKDASGNWLTTSGGRKQNVSSDPGYFLSPPSFGASASGIALLVGLQRVDELRAGSIDHVVGFASPVVGSGPVWPAQRQDSDAANVGVNDPLAPHEGTIMRLPASMNIDALNITPYAKMLAKAIQEYGMVVQDRAAHATFFAEDAAQYSCNPYFATCSGVPPIMHSNPNETGELANFPWSSLQVVNMPVGGF